MREEEFGVGLLVNRTGGNCVRKFAALLGASLLVALSAEAKIEKASFGETPEHQKVDLYTLTNASGMVVKLSTYGAVIQSLSVPGRDGRMADIVRGFDSLDGYLAPGGSHIGAVIGRYANRIKGAQFVLEGTAYHLIANNGPNTLHGGPVGFDKRVWTAQPKDGASPSLTLSYLSSDGEQNFPGALKVTVTYTLQADNALRIDYRATTDKPTVVNLTNHAYFNLKGHDHGDVLEHRLQIMADSIAASDADRIPTGELTAVKGTPFDFTELTPIGKNIESADPRTTTGTNNAPGYDHAFVIRGKPGTLRLAARIEEPSSGRVMEVLTTQPGAQLYTANSVRPVAGKGGAQYTAHGAFCFETEHHPDSPNQPSFPSTELKPGETFHETTVFRFPKPRG
jgi:aldose 1-epimerase